MSVEIKQTVHRVTSNEQTLIELRGKLDEGCMVANITPIILNGDTFCIDYVLEYVVPNEKKCAFCIGSCDGQCRTECNHEFRVGEPSTGVGYHAVCSKCGHKP